MSNITINLSPLEGVGVDIILDCVGGSYWEKNVNCLALDGRWILYGLIGGGDVNGPLFSKLLFKRGSLISSLLRPRDFKVSGKRVCHPENCCTDSVTGEAHKETCHLVDRCVREVFRLAPRNLWHSPCYTHTHTLSIRMNKTVTVLSLQGRSRLCFQGRSLLSVLRKPPR